ncbi:MAG: tRNA 4-thiouridine(8) synthase ThiI, partial [Deltaproteobacteria bacterium]
MPVASDVVVLRYHEIALKGRNRPFFVRRLAEHVERLCADLPVGPVSRASARLLLPLHDPAAWPTARARLGRVFGLANYTLAHEVRLAADPGESLARVGDTVLAHLAGQSVRSFRVATKRSDKRFPLTSPEVNRVLGARIQAATAAPVDLEAAALTVGLDILPGRAFVSLEKVRIDSPVAAWRMMRRGCRVDFVHFHSVPFLDRTSQEKARELARLLAEWELEAELFFVPFGEVQRQIVVAVPRPLRVVLYRRMMIRIAEVLARQHGAEALVTGESLGQVASQTLGNLAVIGAATVMPILQP